MTILIANAAVEVDLSVDKLAVFTSDAAAQPTALMDVDGRSFGGEVEVRHLEKRATDRNV